MGRWNWQPVGLAAGFMQAGARWGKKRVRSEGPARASLLSSQSGTNKLLGARVFSRLPQTAINPAVPVASTTKLKFRH